MFEQVGEFSYFWTAVVERYPSFVFVSFFGLFLVFCCCICRLFSLSKSFCGKFLFVATSCIDVHSFCFFFGINGRECILVIWYLKEEILYSIGWFGKKLMVLSVVVAFRNLLISGLDGFWIINR
jgi:hypothetical protein